MVLDFVPKLSAFMQKGEKMGLPNHPKNAQNVPFCLTGTRAQAGQRTNEKAGQIGRVKKQKSDTASRSQPLSKGPWVNRK